MTVLILSFKVPPKKFSTEVTGRILFLIKIFFKVSHVPKWQVIQDIEFSSGAEKDLMLRTYEIPQVSTLPSRSPEIPQITFSPFIESSFSPSSIVFWKNSDSNFNVSDFDPKMFSKSTEQSTGVNTIFSTNLSNAEESFSVVLNREKLDGKFKFGFLPTSETDIEGMDRTLFYLDNIFLIC